MPISLEDSEVGGVVVWAEVCRDERARMSAAEEPPASLDDFPAVVEGGLFDQRLE